MSNVNHNEGKWHDTLNQLRIRLRTRMDGDTSQAQRERGLDYGINFGVNIIHLKELAQSLPQDRDLADLMWHKNVREMQLLSLMIIPRDSIEMDKAIQLAEECKTLEVAEQLTHLQLRHLSYATDLVLELFNNRYSPNTIVSVIPYLLMMHTANREDFTKHVFNQIKGYIIEDLSAERFTHASVMYNALTRLLYDRPGLDIKSLCDAVISKSLADSVGHRIATQIKEMIEEE